MKWRGREGSSNVDDRRGRGVRGGAGLGIGGLIIVALFTLLTGGDLGDVIGNISGMSGPAIEQRYEPTQQEEELAQFSKVVFKDTEDVWNGLFEQMGEEYVEPGMVLYTGSVNSGCGYASAQIGPFYCPADSKVYIDLSFYKDLNNKFGASGDFAFAYVIAHEVGHHVQNLYGISSQVQSLRQKLSQTEYNKYSVAMELQADYLAGVFAAHQRDKGYLDVGDIEEAMNAASQIGDDNIQRQTQGYVVPDSFTHGTSAQRREWFERGYNAGDLSDWDTFKALGL
ncbi:putative metalloprotease [Peptoniphilus sp. ING2-D1G]|nr:putative metalloprotease [Peptoniphilus sp. ING2-D1G]